LLSLGSLHFLLKYSIIKPLDKKVHINNMAYYRRILLLIPFSKVFKKFIHLRLLENLNDDDDDDNNNNNNNHNILVYEQFVFITRSSAEETNYRRISEILNAFNKVCFVIWKKQLVVLIAEFYCLN
jgi:hypothetical protein